MYGNPNHVHAGPGVGLVRHSSMGADLVLHGHTTQPPSRHAFQQQATSTSSHSRSYSQPPSEHRIQPGQIRSANTAVSSPVKVPFQNLDPRGYEVTFEGLVNSRSGSPARRPSSFGQDAAGGPSAINGQYQSHQIRHSHQYAQESDSQHHQEQQQQRTPVQSHATLRNFDALFPPTSSAPLFTPPNASWGQLSSVAMALDLHGASHPYNTGHAPMSGSQSGFGMQANGAYGSHFMEQYLDFDTNALDLATTVTGTHANLLSPNSSNHSISSPPSQYPITPSTVSNHIQSPASVYSQKHPPIPAGSKPVFKTPNLPASRTLNPNTYLQQQHQQQQQFTPSPPSLLPGSMSMDDSMIVTQPPQSQLPHGGMTRRESFSYGTTTANQNANSGMMLSLNRVQSAGSAGAGSASSSVPQAHHHLHRSAAAQENFKQKGWDKTITTRRAKRASWGTAQSFGDA